ncbi:MAG: cyclic nucleotide-binding domain-containing protein, partial [Chloroflexi bacterium]|nr:cyclic nucleotide-binding domain-containing protein [Chloroflexota bacterium]
MKLQILRKVPLFARLSDGDLRLIERQLQLRTYRVGDLVFSEGDPSEAMYLVKSGSLEVVPDAAPGRQPLALLGEGGFFGDVALVSSRSRSNTVRVTSDRAEIWLLDKARFQGLLA